MKEILQKTIEDMLQIMDFQGKVLLEEDETGLRANIEMEEAPILIGQAGAHLFYLQQIIKKIIEKKTGSIALFNLDINNYRKHKIELLKELALSTAEKVSIEGRPVILQPMNSFERRIIHTVLANHQNLETESQGEEPNRRIIVKIQNAI